MSAIGPYEILAPLGEGAFGSVFRARAPSGAEVALKLLVRESERARARFAREVDAIRRLDHPAIVPLLDHGQDRGRPYLVMEFVEGQTFERLVERERALAPSRAAELALEAASAIEHAHARGVLHRDLKPANVIVDRAGRVRVLDFGLASLQDAEERLSISGQALGTLAYMAPEQAVGRSAGPATDVYGLGAVLYHLLTGQGPLESSGNPYLALHREVPPPPSSLRPEVGPALDAVCARALAKEPDERYPDAAAFGAALREHLEVSGPPSPGSRRGLGAGLLTLVACVGAALFVLYGRNAGSSANESERPTAPQALDPLEAALEGGALPENLAGQARALGGEADARACERFAACVRAIHERRPTHEVLELGLEATRLAEHPALAIRLRLDVADVLIRRNRATDALELLGPLTDGAPGMTPDRRARSAFLRVFGLNCVRRTADAEAAFAAIHLPDETRWTIPIRALRSALTVGPKGTSERTLAAAAACEDDPSGYLPALRLSIALRLQDAERALAYAGPALRAARTDRLGESVWIYMQVLGLVGFPPSKRAEAGLPQDCRPLFERARALCEPSVPLELLVMEANHRAGGDIPDLKLALDLLDRVAQLEHEQQEPFVLRWQVLERLGHYERARASLVAAYEAHGEALLEAIQRLSSPPHRLRALRLLGAAHAPKLSSGQSATVKGIEASLGEDRLRVAIGPAIQRWVQGQPWAALEPGFKRALTLAPEHPVLLRLLVMALISRRRLVEAGRLLDDARGRLRKTADDWLRAEVAFERSDPARFLSLLRELQGRGGYSTPLARSLLAIRLKDNATALAELEGAIAADPKAPAVTWGALLVYGITGQTKPSQKLALACYRDTGFLTTYAPRFLGQATLVIATRARDTDTMHRSIELLESCLSAAPNNTGLLRFLISHTLLPPAVPGFEPAVGGWIHDFAALESDPRDVEGFRGLRLLAAGASREAVDAHWTAEVRARLPKAYLAFYAQRFAR